MVLVIEMEGLNRGMFGDDGDLNAYSIHVSARSSVFSSARQGERFRFVNKDTVTSKYK